MAKRSRRRSQQSKDNAGCMWGFISLFDFRQGHSTRKLLSDRKHGSSRNGVPGYSTNKFELLRDLDEESGDINGDARSEAGTVDLAMASVKSLMQEEMSNSNLAKKNPSDVSRRQSKKNHKKADKSSKLAAVLVDDLNLPESDQSHCSINHLEQSITNFDVTAFVADFCVDNHQCSDKHVVSHAEHESDQSENFSIIQKALSDVGEVFLRYKFNDEKQVSDKEAVYQSKRFIEAIETLNTNKELILRLMEDPNSVILKHLQDLQNAQTDSHIHEERSEILGEEIGSSAQSEESARHKLIEKQNGHSFFWKKDKSKSIKTPKESRNNQNLNRIVVLKPNASIPQSSLVTNMVISPSSSPISYYDSKHPEVSERVGSYFSLREIKRRFKQAIGENKKERHLISMDGILHKIPYGHKSFDDIGKQKSIEKAVHNKIFGNGKNTPAQSSDNVLKKDKLKSGIEDASLRSNIPTTSQLMHREPSFYEEAKRHLVDMLNSAEEKETLPSKQGSKSLGKVLSLPEYNSLSPRLSPGRDKETELLPRCIIFSPNHQAQQENFVNNLSPRKQVDNEQETNSCLDINPQLVEMLPELIENHIQVDINIEEESDTKVVEEILERDNAEPNVLRETCKEEVSESSPLGSYDETPSTASPSNKMPSTLFIHNAEAPDNLIDKPERPSPVSVLGPFFTEDVGSPQSASLGYTDLPIQPRQLQYEEHQNSSIVMISPDCGANLRTCLDDKEVRGDFIRTALKATGLCCDKIPERWHLSDQLFELSLLDEVGISYSQLTDDPQLLFDCINEVLVEIHERYFSCSAWLSLVRRDIRPVPKGANFIEEVCKGIEWHLKPQFPTTLDQLIGKDMESAGWMDIRVDHEHVFVQMADEILTYLMEEAILEI
ncbi:hypothetical protein IHE45_02G070500 [Dioscorea alata]|uniref:Uncharacterized protein n=2 Tax=Dioscorea alata TaxID=55571 RepID=A0ACB7WQJ0_DIOAL|nr:hypothetical protein IHE45_02G070500 [Dioscorea alata]KAH7690750.1 hypothetical protein IHE45_02G070500 [Dioscorea alata]